MYLVYYPISMYDEQVVGHPTSSFRVFNTDEPSEAREVFGILLMQFGIDNLHIYDMSSTSRTTRFCNIDDMVDDLNGQELDVENNWCVRLNLTEDEMLEMSQYASRDFVIVENETRKPIVFNSDNEMVVYGDFDEAADDSLGGRVIGLLTYDTDEEGRQRVEYYDMKMEDVRCFAYGDVSEESWNRDCYEAICDFNGDFTIKTIQ